MIVSAAFESPAVVAGFNDIAMMSEAIEQRRGHFGVAEYARPFTEGEIGGDDYRGALVEAADEVEQELAMCRFERCCVAPWSAWAEARRHHQRKRKLGRSREPPHK